VVRPSPALLLSLSLLAACSSGGERAAHDAAPRPVAVPAPLDAGPADVDAAPAAKVADPAARLRAGRALVQKQRWQEALAALDEAAAAGGVDALAELAFTAVRAGDADRAEAASRAVLDHPASSDRHRATAHYHLGRAAELRGDLAAARDEYGRSLELDRSRSVVERLERLAPRRALAAPGAPPCAAPRPAAEICACLVDELASDGARCVKSHDQHAPGVWTETVVARDRAPIFLVAAADDGKARVVAALGATEASITGWSVLPGPDGAPLLRVDVREGRREDALLCRTTGTPRCFAKLPLVEEVGTPAQIRRLDVALAATDARGVVQVTLVEGPPNPADVLGTHRLW